MKKDFLITSEQLTADKTAFQLIVNTCPTALCLFSENNIPDKAPENTTLIVINDSRELFKHILKTNTFPEYIPILVLGIPDVSSLPPDDQRERRLIDFLPLPVNLELLRYKISFLNHIQGISRAYYDNLNTHERVLDNLSKRDGLTGLFNRRYLTEILKTEFHRAQSMEEDLSLLILNIDYFNEINKSYGLKFGDAVLNEISARLTVNTREVDSCYRFSGEDFVILMPQADLNLAIQTGEKIRTACSDKPFCHFGQQKSITVSLGIASLKNHALQNHDEFISTAETALYMAKAGGRNRVHALTTLGVNKGYNSQQSLAILKETINRILDKTRSSTISSLQLLAKEIAGVEYKDHIDRVSHYIKLLGSQLGLPPHLITTLQNAIILHNSIRFFLHNDLFSKQSVISAKEREMMNDLPFKLADLTDIFDYFANERTVLLSHGEHYDGNGSPHGLKGNEIPFAARLFNIVDSLVAMDSERPFRKRLNPDAIIKELINEAGKQFDPHLVLQLLEMIKEHNLLDLDSDHLERTYQDMLNNFPEIEP